jgi:hypothetical protein
MRHSIVIQPDFAAESTSFLPLSAVNYDKIRVLMPFLPHHGQFTNQTMRDILYSGVKSVLS